VLGAAALAILFSAALWAGVSASAFALARAVLVQEAAKAIHPDRLLRALLD